MVIRRLIKHHVSEFLVNVVYIGDFVYGVVHLMLNTQPHVIGLYIQLQVYILENYRIFFSLYSTCLKTININNNILKSGPR